MRSATLNNGKSMPMLGYGVFKIEDEEATRCVLDAFDVGYRMIDTAQIYKNEAGVGKAIATCGLPREELFITSKVWIGSCNYEAAKASIEESLNKLQTPYLDLMLIHWPYNDYYGAWRAMQEAHAQGKIKSLGVSNFDSPRLLDILTFSPIKPAVNQVETHLFYQRKDESALMAKHGVLHQAWGPFTQGKTNFFDHPQVQKIGAQYGKTNAQVALAYFIDQGIQVIPKTLSKERMQQNFNIFDFALSAQDKAILASLDEGKPLSPFEEERLVGMMLHT
jgi:2,5-diketo-D-gluconate reductase A